MCESKSTVRSRMRALRGELKTAAADAEIFQRLFSFSPFEEGKDYFVYYSYGSEADTRAIVRELLRRGKRVYLPHTDGENMYLVRYVGQTMRLGAYGIEEPIGEDENVVPDVCVVPFLAADERCRRLGYGGGYYDRYFAKLRRSSAKKCFTVGIGYDFQILTEIPCEPHDAALDAIVTDRRVIIGKTED